MLISPVLADMTLEDLNQRYRQTFVLYNNKPTYIREFTGRREFYIALNADDEQLVRFDWRLLNVERPRSRWYLTDDTTFCFYFGYPPKKQYHRGLCSDNIQISIVNRRPGNWKMYNALLTEGFAPMNSEQIALGKTGVFRDHTLVLPIAGEEGGFKVYYRNQRIARLNVDTGVIKLYHKRFEQEVLEAIAGASDLKLEQIKADPEVAPLDVGDYLFKRRAERAQAFHEDIGNEVLNPFMEPGIVDGNGHLRMKQVAARRPYSEAEYNALLAYLKLHLVGVHVGVANG